MNVMRLNLVSVWVVVLAFLFVTACNEDEASLPGEEEVTQVGDESDIANSFDEIEDLAFIGIFATSDLGGRVETDERLGCATVTKEEVEGIVTVVIDFGDGCTGPDGRTRVGKIIVVHDGKIWQYDSSITITMEGFSINGIQIEGTRTVTNKTTQSSNGIVHQVSLVGGKITWNDGTFATRDANKTRTWNRSNVSPREDTLTLEGGASGQNRKGVSYVMEIIEPVIFKRNCRNSKIFIPVSGVKQITTENAVITVDFGDGECDRKVIVTRNGASREVTLGR